MKVATDYVLIEKIGGVLITPDADHLALECWFDGKWRHLIIASHDAPALAIAFSAAAQICGRVQNATLAEKADPEFDAKMEKELVKLQKRMVAELTTANANQINSQF